MQNRTRASLGNTEAAFLSKIGKQRFFSIQVAGKILGQRKSVPTSQFLESAGSRNTGLFEEGQKGGRSRRVKAA